MAFLSHHSCLLVSCPVTAVSERGTLDRGHKGPQCLGHSGGMVSTHELTSLFRYFSSLWVGPEWNCLLELNSEVDSVEIQILNGVNSIEALWGSLRITIHPAPSNTLTFFIQWFWPGPFFRYLKRWSLKHLLFMNYSILCSIVQLLQIIYNLHKVTPYSHRHSAQLSN